MHYEIKKIGGIDCIFAPMQGSNAITLDISVKAGSKYESYEIAGISHALEHMFFKGGKKWSTPHAVATAMDQIGAEFNAGTGRSVTSYYIKAAPQFWQEGLEMLADMLIDAQCNAQELEREKGVIIQELKMYEDNPLSVLREKRSLFFFGENSYGRPIIGYEDTINALTRSKLMDYRNQLYTKDNILITIAGQIKEQSKLETMIANLFSPLHEKKTREKPEFSRQLPEKKSDFFLKKTEQKHLLLTMPGFTAFEEGRYAAKVLSTVLGGNMSSLLFQEIREKLGLCYYIGASHNAGEEYGLFSIRAGIAKGKFDFALEKIHSLLDQTIREGIKKEAFENAKSYLKGSIQMGIETSDEIANFLASQWLTYGKIESLDDILENYECVQLDSVHALLEKLKEENRRIFWVE